MPHHIRESAGPFLLLETSVANHDLSHRCFDWLSRAAGIRTMTAAKGQWPPESLSKLHVNHLKSAHPASTVSLHTSLTTMHQTGLTAAAAYRSKTLFYHCSHLLLLLFVFGLSCTAHRLILHSFKPDPTLISWMKTQN